MERLLAATMASTHKTTSPPPAIAKPAAEADETEDAVPGEEFVYRPPRSWFRIRLGFVDGISPVSRTLVIMKSDRATLQSQSLCMADPCTLVTATQLREPTLSS